MTAYGRTVRNVVIGVTIAAATAGLSACGSSNSDKVNPNAPATQAPNNTTPATSKAPSSGGAAF